METLTLDQWLENSTRFKSLVGLSTVGNVTIGDIADVDFACLSCSFEPTSLLSIVASRTLERDFNAQKAKQRELDLLVSSFYLINTQS